MQMYYTLFILPSLFSKRSQHFSPLPVLVSVGSCQAIILGAYRCELVGIKANFA